MGVQKWGPKIDVFIHDQKKGSKNGVQKLMFLKGVKKWSKRGYPVKRSIFDAHGLETGQKWGF